MQNSRAAGSELPKREVTGWGLGFLSAHDTGTTGAAAAASSALWLGWRQVHEHTLKSARVLCSGVL